MDDVNGKLLGDNPRTPFGGNKMLGRWALGFTLGLIWLQTRPVLPDWRAPLGLAVLLLLPGLKAEWAASRWWRRGGVVLAAALLGLAWGSWRAGERLAVALPAAWEGRDVRVEGQVRGLPQAFAGGERFEFQIEKVLTPEAVLPERLLLSWYRQREGQDAEAAVLGAGLRAGERWQLTLRLKRPHGNANPGGFDYEAWLLEQNLRATGYVRAVPAALRLDPAGFDLGSGIARLRQQVRERFFRLLPEADYPFVGVLVALAVGDQRAIQSEWWPLFNRTGTVHLMSISGLHVTLFAALVGGLVRALWRRSVRLTLRWPATLAGLVAGNLAALAYTLLAGAGVPALRTLCMLTVASIARCSGRVLAVRHVLALALLVVLLFDPWAVLAAGFWLSFGVPKALTVPILNGYAFR